MVTSTVRDALRTVTQDSRITDQEWHTVLQVAVDAQPRRATPEGRLLLETWANSSFEVEPEARRHLRDYLHSRGYAVPAERPAHKTDAALVREVEASNVGAPDRTFAALARAAGKGTAEVNVAVLDNGFDLWHPGLGYKGWVNEQEIPANGQDDDRNGKVDDSHGWDFVDWNNDVGHPSGDWHGTHVAGIATRGTDRVNVLPMRVLQGPHPYDVNQVAAAIDYAVEHGARVINMSFGIDTPERVRVFREAMARHPQVLFVAAAGNDGRSLESYDRESFLPAGEYPNLAVVSSADADGAPSGFTNHGPTAHLAARGSEVLSTVPGGGYDVISGTSMAAPEVTGTAAKVMILDPALSPAQTRRLLAETSDQSPQWEGKVQAGGTLNPARAFRLAGLCGLVRGGMTPGAAAARLGVHGQERARLLPLIPAYLG